MLGLLYSAAGLLCYVSEVIMYAIPYHYAFLQFNKEIIAWSRAQLGRAPQEFTGWNWLWGEMFLFIFFLFE